MTDGAAKRDTGLTEPRPTRSPLYPWYDSVWLAKYVRAKAIIQTVRPDPLAAFVDAFRIHRTRPDFQVRLFERPFDDQTLHEIRRVAQSFRPTDLEPTRCGRSGVSWFTIIRSSPRCSNARCLSSVKRWARKSRCPTTSSASIRLRASVLHTWIHRRQSGPLISA